MPAPSASPTTTAVPVNVEGCGQAVNVFISESANLTFPHSQSENRSGGLRDFWARSVMAFAMRWYSGRE